MRAPRIVGGFLLALASGRLAGAATVYTVAEAKSSVRIHVDKSGAFSFAGHRHEVQAPVSGTIAADPEDLSASSVELTFASGRLHVLPEGEPAGDAPRVEEVMHGPQVLDAVRFPEIQLRSKMVTGEKRPGGGYDLILDAELSLHGVTREIRVPVKVTFEGRSLTATGQTTVRHDQFGMKPVSAGGGTVKVANDLHIDFEIVADPR
jgi:polyisoprenoid-binding protein YceI